ncbi:MULTISPECIES: hypothetical protein [unclassified Bradyrhizobium]|nr:MULTISPECIES: hypothetical protein [unclassified Bradyrhizobium]
MLGGVDQPKVKVTDAFKIFCNEIRAAEIAGKPTTAIGLFRAAIWKTL